MTPRLLAATGNPGKLKEIRAILEGLNILILSPKDIQIHIDVEETGRSYAENARIKAQAYYQASRLPILADDSGLEVDALGGAPGIHSARFSPKKNADDADRRAYLLQQMKGKPQPWKAHFHCTAVLLLPGFKLIEKVGQCPGIIIPEERGNSGFGYDPLFYIPEYQATMAELGEDLKNKISHRAEALKQLLPDLNQYFQENNSCK